MNTKISIVDAEFFAYHGYYPEERQSGHQFKVTISVVVDTFTDQEDGIEDTVNYESLYKIAKIAMNNTQQLIESVAVEILDTIKTSFPTVKNSYVKIEKLCPPLGGKVGKSVIEMNS